MPTDDRGGGPGGAHALQVGIGLAHRAERAINLAGISLDPLLDLLGGHATEPHHPAAGPIGQLKGLLNRHATGRFASRRSAHAVGHDERIAGEDVAENRRLVAVERNAIARQIRHQDFVSPGATKDAEMVLVGLPHQPLVSTAPNSTFGGGEAGTKNCNAKP